jgi:hypothetical protein
LRTSARIRRTSARSRRTGSPTRSGRFPAPKFQIPSLTAGIRLAVDGNFKKSSWSVWRLLPAEAAAPWRRIRAGFSRTFPPASLD